MDRKVITEKLAGVTKPNRKPRAPVLTQRDKLDRRISHLETQALSFEERAEYAEKEAQLKKRIRDAQSRIKATQPPGMLDGFHFPSVGSVWSKIPPPLKAMGVLVVVIVVLLLLGKSCSSGA